MLQCRLPPRPALRDLVMWLREMELHYRGAEVGYTKKLLVMPAMLKNYCEGWAFTRQISMEVDQAEIDLDVRINSKTGMMLISNCLYTL